MVYETRVEKALVTRVLDMVSVGRYNVLKVINHTKFGLYLNGGKYGQIFLPNRYIPKHVPSEDQGWIKVFIYLDRDDKLISTTEAPKVQVGEFASLKVIEVNSIGIFLDWGLPKDLLLPYSEEKHQMAVGEYCVVRVYLDKHTGRVTATENLDLYLDNTPAHYKVGQEVDLLVAESTDMGFKAIINNNHWGLIHKNEVFKFLRPGKEDKGFIREVRSDGKISLSLQPVGREASSILKSKILDMLHENNGALPVSDKSAPAVISRLFGVSKANFKKAIGALYKQGKIVISADSIEIN